MMEQDPSFDDVKEMILRSFKPNQPQTPLL